MAFDEDVGRKNIRTNTKTPIDFINLFVEDLVDTLVRETNAYGSGKCGSKAHGPKSHFRHWKDKTNQDMQAFLGLIINMRLFFTNQA